MRLPVMARDQGSPPLLATRSGRRSAAVRAERAGGVQAGAVRAGGAPSGGVPAAAPPQAMAGLAVHGNWCGPGHGGGGPPVDPVDQVCFVHDRCYDQRGYFDCSCDRELVARMPAAVAHPATPVAGKVAGAAAAALFSATPCLCRRACLPFLGCISSPVPVPGLPGVKRCPPPFA